MNKKYAIEKNGMACRVCVTDDPEKIKLGPGETIRCVGNERVRRGDPLQGRASVSLAPEKKIPWVWLGVGAVVAAAGGLFYFIF